MDCETDRCIACRWFEPRSGFCRFNPPTPIAIPDSAGFHLMSAFPKIPAPNLDYCSKFEHISPAEKDDVVHSRRAMLLNG